MNLSIVIIIIDWLLWIIIAANVMYVLFFTITSLLPKRPHHPLPITHHPSTFLVLFPAYHEDTVILHSVKSFLQQDYPKDSYQVVVISDHMTSETNEQLSALPITLLQPTFEHSSKAKALQYAISSILHQTSSIYDHVVILDADNLVGSDFLTRLNQIVTPNQAIQCHRTAKNADNDIAALDGISEEINNSIFRKGHNRIGMSSALIGSGMCFDYKWFKDNVNHLDSAVEDRELEALLMKQGIYIHYAEDIHVLDEKVSNSDTFQRQRLRWMTGQVQALFCMLPYIPKAIVTGNINYIDKAIQQALIPRSILLFLIPVFSLILFCIAPVWSLKWWILFLVLCLSLYIAIPSQMRNSAVFGKLSSFPALALKMLKNLFNLNKSNKDFLHTTHGNE